MTSREERNVFQARALQRKSPCWTITSTVALSLADWSVLDARATVTVFNDHIADADAVVERLQPFDIVCVMRERTPMTRSVIERLTKLRLIASTGSRNASIDLKAAEERGVQVVHTGYTSAPTIELTWALILGSARNSSPRTPRYAAAVGSGSLGTTLPGERWAFLVSAMSATP